MKIYKFGSIHVAAESAEKARRILRERLSAAELRESKLEPVRGPFGYIASSDPTETVRYIDAENCGSVFFPGIVPEA